MSNSLRAEVLQQLREMGSDITREHGFDFYLYVPSESAASAAAQKIRGSRFSVDIAPDALGSSRWLCCASTTLVPEVAPLDEIGRLFEQVAATLGGEFDGWESDVIKK